MTATEKVYDRRTASFLAAIGQKMPELTDDVMQGWIDYPKALEIALWHALSPFANPREFPTWKTIKLSAQESAEEYSKALLENGFQVNDWATYLLQKIPLAEVEIDLVLATARDLDFTTSVPRAVIYRRAQELGLDLIPAAVGPQLRLEYTDQPVGEHLLMGMTPIADSDASFVFSPLSISRNRVGVLGCSVAIPNLGGIPITGCSLAARTDSLIIVPALDYIQYGFFACPNCAASRRK